MTTKRALLLLLAAVVAFFAPLIVRGEVVFPHDNGLELGLPEDADSAHLANRRFTDASSVFVPEIDLHLHGDRSGWLATWNPHVGLGRPAMQVSGLSPAYPPMRVLAWLTSDALVLFTALVLLTVAATALFAFLFFGALGLDPRAALAASAALALGVYPIYWLAFPMYLASLCWTLCALWNATRFVERPGAWRGLGVGFSVYALLLSGYPQQILWHALLAAGFLVLHARSWRKLAALGAWAALGVACAAPVYLDLALQAARSTRLGMGPDFFRPALPEIENLGDLGLFLAQLFDARWFGNPVDPAYGRAFKGLSFGPLVCGLVLVCAVDGAWRRTAWWLGFSVLCLVLTLWPGAYLFGVEHLGLGFSRFTPLAAALIPLAACSAIALDRLLRGEIRRRRLGVLLLAPLLALAGAALATMSMQPGAVALGLGLFAAFAACAWSGRARWIPALVVAAAFVQGLGLLLARPEARIQRSSPLVERIREETAGGWRYALVGFEHQQLLPPNQETWLGLRSVHTYDPLVPRDYGEWVLRISETGLRSPGRQFRRIASGSKLDGAELGRAGVSLFVSTLALSSPRLEALGDIGPVHLYRVRRRPALEAQLGAFEDEGSRGEAELRGPLEELAQLPVERLAGHADQLRWRVTPAGEPTLLFVSQQFHPQWRAYAAGAELETVRIDGFWQGVRLPPGTDSVELRFEPWARWSWIPQLLFACAGLAYGLSRLRARA